MTLEGTLRYRDLGSGTWVLETPDGTAYDLHPGDVPAAVLERSRDRSVVVEGELSGSTGGGFGFGMAGSASVTVRRLTQA